MVQSMKQSNGSKRIKLSKKYKGGRVAFPIKYYGGLGSKISTNPNISLSKMIIMKGGVRKKSKKKSKKKNSKKKSKKSSNKILRNTNLQRKKVNYNMKKLFNLT